MKKHLLIGASILAFGITTTAIYAQVTGTSVVDKMKAVAHSFTLATTLNPTDSGLTSDPVKGKKTGDILTAGEWNRVLELVSEGGGSGGTGSPVSSRAVAVRASGHTLAIPSGITDWPDAIVCDGYGGWAGGTEVLSLDLTGNNVVGYTQSEGIGVFFDPSTGVLSRADRVGACGASNIATICAAGRCVYGGGASAAGGLSLYKCTNAQSMDSTNAPCYGASRNGGAGTSQYRVVSCTDNDGTRSYTMSSILNFGQLVTNKWAVSVNGGTIECDDGTVLVMATQGGGSSGSSASTWADVSLTDTADYDTSCEYRFQMNKAMLDGVWSFGSPTPAGNHYYYATYVANNIIAASGTYNVMHGIPKGTKNKMFLYWVNGTGVDSSANYTITKIQKRCN